MMATNPEESSEPSFVDLVDPITPPASVGSTIATLVPRPTSMAAWEVFAREDLARSGLTPELMEVKQPAVSEGFGIVAYDVVYPHITPPFSVTRYKTDDKDKRYKGPPGRNELYWTCHPSEFAKAPIVAIIEGEKKARAIYLTTGIPTVGIRGCAGWSDQVKSPGSDATPHRVLKAGIQAGLGSNRICIIGLDGDYANNPDISRELAQLNMACRESGSTTVCVDFGFDAEESRYGADDWLVAKFGIDCIGKVDSNKVKAELLSLKYRLDIDKLIASEAWCLHNLERYNNELVDFTDRGNASLTLKLLGVGNLLWLKDLSSWVYHNKERNRWEILEADTPTELLNVVSLYRTNYANVLRARMSAAKTQGKTMSDDDMEIHLKQVQAWEDSATRLSSFRVRATILNELKGREEVNATLESFVPDPDILPVANGVVDLRTGLLREEVQNDRILHRCPVGYYPDKVYPPVLVKGPDGTEIDMSVAARTRRFITEMYATKDGALRPELECYDQRRTGASLRGRCELGSLEIWVSPPATGKSVKSELMRQTLGPFCKTINVDALLTMKENTSTKANTFLMSIVQTRIVFLKEADRGERWSHRMLKTLTGVVDRVSSREMYGKATEFDVLFTMYLLCNDVPDMRNSDDALLERIAILPLEHKVRRVNQTVDLDSRDLPLEDLWYRDQMPNEPDAQEVMLAWMIEGSVAYEQIKPGVGTAPDVVIAAKLGYAASQDTVKNWIIENFEVTGRKEDAILARHMHYVYFEEAKSMSNTLPLNMQDFKLEVSRAFHLITHGRAGRGEQHFIGLKALMPDKFAKA